ncbi:hypothetical protein NDU88_006345, partial [Pleurodeles waltl]
MRARGRNIQKDVQEQAKIKVHAEELTASHRAPCRVSSDPVGASGASLGGYYSRCRNLHRQAGHAGSTPLCPLIRSRPDTDTRLADNGTGGCDQ